ncbi:hypothetical protein N8I71_13695 [Roseibacterium sp. SDUM158016]|jgi:hypothetical protein|uniref:hypothetical protein n=1 Tax=Roseicyclus sediminis TaxID=2980997 RepID=UPI0021CE80D0|nr:hypothetical protein [Roseibacterium sp. SDUM158016]MCU4653893.1 hypothetical protein [Roseibacterium sp. SDUM158016]
MAGRPTDTEMQRRIAALLMTRCAGRAVARHLCGEAQAWAHRASVAELRARRLDDLAERMLLESETPSPRRKERAH